MSEQPFRTPPRPAHLFAPWPAHFRLRTDLIEELCVPDAFVRTLPRTPEAHARWLAFWNRSADEIQFGSIRPFVGRPYEATARYLLHPAILPGSEHIQNVLTDGRGWSVCCELGGLYEFVIDRAVEFAVSRGCPKPNTRAAFYPAYTGKAERVRRHARWAVGYERSTGLGTILWREQDDTEARYLAGEPGYTVPAFGCAGEPS